MSQHNTSHSTSVSFKSSHKLKAEQEEIRRKIDHLLRVIRSDKPHMYELAKSLLAPS